MWSDSSSDESPFWIDKKQTNPKNLQKIKNEIMPTLSEKQNIPDLELLRIKDVY